MCSWISNWLGCTLCHRGNKVNILKWCVISLLNRIKQSFNKPDYKIPAMIKWNTFQINIVFSRLYHRVCHNLFALILTVQIWCWNVCCSFVKINMDNRNRNWKRNSDMKLGVNAKSSCVWRSCHFRWDKVLAMQTKSSHTHVQKKKKKHSYQIKSFSANYKMCLV